MRHLLLDKNQPGAEGQSMAGITALLSMFAASPGRCACLCMCECVWVWVCLCMCMPLCVCVCMLACVWLRIHSCHHCFDKLIWHNLFSVLHHKFVQLSIWTWSLLMLDAVFGTMLQIFNFFSYLTFPHHNSCAAELPPGCHLWNHHHYTGRGLHGQQHALTDDVLTGQRAGGSVEGGRGEHVPVLAVSVQSGVQTSGGGWTGDRWWQRQWQRGGEGQSGCWEVRTLQMWWYWRWSVRR